MQKPMILRLQTSHESSPQLCEFSRILGQNFRKNNFTHYHCIVAFILLKIRKTFLQVIFNKKILTEYFHLDQDN